MHDTAHPSDGLEEAAFRARGQGRRFAQGQLAERLHELGGAGLVEEIGALIRGRSASPLQGLISGSVDLDKIDYLCRDSQMCGVPYGTVDVDRLLASLCVVEAAGGRREIGVRKKREALDPALRQYQMYRKV